MTHEARLGAGLSLPIAIVKDLRRLQRDLTIVDEAELRAQAAGFKTRSSRSPYIQEYRLLGDRVEVPRHYRPELTEQPAVIDARPPARPASGPRIDARIRLRDDQVEPAKILEEGHDGLLVLRPGAGKTVLALHRIATLRRGPALIVVPNTFLFQQWQERIGQHISYVEGGVGRIGNGAYDWQGRGIVLGTIQSLTLRSHDPSFYNYFTDVICDEAHVSLAPKYRRLFWRFPGYRLCLSASPDKESGWERLWPLHVGRVLFNNLTLTRKPRIFFYETNVVVKDTGNPYHQPIYITHLAKSRERNLILADLFRAAMRNPNRRILALGERKAQLRALHRWLGPERAGLCIAEVPPDERVRNLDRFRYNVAIARLARDGLDAVLLDTLFALYTIPKKGGLLQAIGRTLRDPGPSEAKEPSVVILVEDKRNPNGDKMARKMRRALRALGLTWEDRVARAPEQTPDNLRLADLVEQCFGGEMEDDADADEPVVDLPRDECPWE
jgi:superfamily II DNA or RNA helicase